MNDSYHYLAICGIIAQTFGEFFLNITHKIEELQNLISASAVQLGLVETELDSNQPFPDDNGCFFELIGNNKFYMMSHKNIRVMEDFFDLSLDTISNIEHVRQFGFKMLNRVSKKNHRSQSITMNTQEDFLVIVLHGNGLPSLSIKINTHVVVVSLDNSIQSQSCKIDNYNSMNVAVNSAVNTIIRSLLKKAGFHSSNEQSPEVVAFMSKTAKELFNERDIDSRFNYLTLNELVYSVCQDLNLNLNDVLSGVSANETINNIYVPNNLTTMLSSVAQKIVNIDGLKSKIDQLICLFVFIDNLKNKPIRCSLTLREIEKTDFFVNGSIDRSYYILNIGSFVIHIGHKIPKVLSKNSYIDSSNGVNLFSFFTVNNGNYEEYITNDLDYIYNLILTDIREHISETISNKSGIITLKDLEVYKMAII